MPVGAGKLGVLTLSRVILVVKRASPPLVQQEQPDTVFVNDGILRPTSPITMTFGLDTGGGRIVGSDGVVGDHRAGPTRFRGRMGARGARFPRRSGCQIIGAPRLLCGRETLIADRVDQE